MAPSTPRPKDTPRTAALRDTAAGVIQLKKKVLPCHCACGDKAMFLVMDALITLNGLYLSVFLLFYFTQYDAIKNAICLLIITVNFFVFAPMNTKNFSFINSIVNIQGSVIGKIIEVRGTDILLTELGSIHGGKTYCVRVCRNCYF